jgi:hypothetical protein
MHSIPARLEVTGDTVLHSPTWPLGLAALLPVARPGRVAIRWRGYLDVDKLLDLFEDTLPYVNRGASCKVAAAVFSGGEVEWLPLDARGDLLRHIGQRGAPEYLRIESTLGPELGGPLASVAWINHDAAPLVMGAQSQQAAGVEIPTAAAASEARASIARAVYSTRPPEDADSTQHSGEEVSRGVAELMADISSMSLGPPRQAS